MIKIFLFLVSFFMMSYISAQSVVFHENFEAPLYGDSVTSSQTSNVDHWGINSILYNSGAYSDSCQVLLGDTTTLTTDAFSTLGNGSIYLEFDHICKIEWVDTAEIQVSSDNGATWTTLIATQYLGSGQFQGGFSSVSYVTTWQAANDAAIPTNSWWKHEIFDISSFVSNSSQVKVRFLLRDGDGDGPVGYTGTNYGWVLDDIKVTASFSELIPPVLIMIPPIVQDSVYSAGNYNIKARISDASGIDTAMVIYSVGTISDTIEMTILTGDTFVGVIPFLGFDETITYHVKAIDASLGQNSTSSNTFTFYTRFSLGGAFQVGNGTTYNNNSSYPTPYGNYYFGTKDQYLILASELQALGLTAGPLGSIGFDVQNKNNCPILNNYEIKIGHTNVTSITAWDTNLVSVYTDTGLAVTNGVNTHTFLYPFHWDGTSNIIVQICLNNTGWTTGGNASVKNHTTSFMSTLNWHADSLDVCQSQTIYNTFPKATRPNIFINKLGVLPNNDAGVYEITSPVLGVSANQNFGVKFKLKNYGFYNITKAVVNWSLNGVLQTPYTYLASNYASIMPDSISPEIILDTLNLSSGNYELKMWTISVNDSIDYRPENDTSTIYFHSCGAPLNGSYTIGSATSDFADIKEAVVALEYCGINGPVDFTIASGIYNEQIEITDVIGSSSTNIITFKSATGDSTDVVLTYNAESSSNYTLKLDGTDFITFKEMTIKSTDTTNANVVILANGSHDVTILNCNIMTDSIIIDGDITRSLISTTDSVGRNIHILNNVLTNGSRAVQLNNPAYSMTGWKVNNNIIHGHFMRAITLINAASAEVIGNDIKASITSNADAYNGILLEANIGSPVISKNKIITSFTNTADGIRINNSSFDSLNPAIIANNMIQIYVSSNISASGSGIRLKAKNIGVYYNSVRTIGNNTNCPAFRVYDSSPYTENLVLRNNIFTNNTGGEALVMSGIDTSKFENDYNVIYRYGGGYIAKYGTTPISDIVSWRSMTGNAVYSNSFNPYFVSASDLHTTNNIINGIGIPIPGITEDFDGETRNVSTPDIGADEFNASPFDIALIEILSPISGCGLSSSEVVMLRLKNVGADTINGSVNISYQLNNGTLITDSITSSMLSGDTLDFTFTTTVNIDVSSLLTDSLFFFKAWASLSGDPIQFNDTLSVYVNSGYQPVPPIVKDTIIPYGTQITLTAGSNDTLYWYVDSITTNTTGIGEYFTTPPLYDTTIYWVEAKGTTTNDFQIGTGTITNSSTGYPSPYGNKYRGSKHQMLILASELQAMGVVPGYIKTISFDVDNVNMCPSLDNFELKIGTTSSSSLTNSWISGLTTVFSAATYTPVVGWNNHIFQTPFMWDGVSNVVVDVCFYNNLFTSYGNASFKQTATSHKSTHYVFNNTSSSCTSPSYGSTAYQRPNIKFNVENQNCPSTRQPIIVEVTPAPSNDAGISQIISPSGSISPGVGEEIVVELSNYGTDTLQSVNIHWTLNNVAQPVFSWNGILLTDSSESVIVDTMIFAGGLFCINARTTMPNGVIDPVSANDSVIGPCFNACMSGSYTIGDTTGGALFSFPSIGAAINAMTLATVCGHVTFLIDSGTYIGQFLFPDIPGAGPNSTITFTSSTGDSSDVTLRFISSSTNKWATKITGNYIKLNKLKISVAGGSGSGRVVELASTAKYNEISNCILEGIVPPAKSNDYSIIYANGGNMEYNVYKNNLMLNGSYPIYLKGSSTNYQEGNVIEGNKIIGFKEYGPYLYFQDSLQFHSNSIDNGTTTSYLQYGLYLYKSKNCDITKNKINIHDPGSKQYAVYVKQCTSAVASPMIFANNFITIGGVGTSSWYGLYLYQSEYLDIYNNSVNMTAGGSNSANFYQTGGGYINHVNNLYVNTSGGYVFYVSTAAAILNTNYNDYYTSGYRLAKWANSNKNNLSALKSASGMESNSVYIDPLFTSATDLHLTGQVLMGLGTPLTEVPDDIDGVIRSQYYPTIGAHEVVPDPFDGGVIAILSPSGTLGVGNSEQVEVIVENFGSDTLTGFNINYKVGNGIPVLYTYSNNLLPAQTDTVILPSISVPPGNFTICAYTVISGDADSTNDQTCGNFFAMPTKDGSANKFVAIAEGCGLNIDTVKIWIQNTGLDTLFGTVPGTITAKYQVNNTLPLISEPIGTDINPGDSILFTFSNTINFAVTTMDSLFEIVAWIDVTSDNVKGNDTVFQNLISMHTPANPIVNNVSVPISSPATLTATSPTNDSIIWYDASYGGNVLGGGSSYQTPNMYSPDTFYVGSMNKYPFINEITTTFNNSNSGSNGNMFDITAVNTITIDSFYINTNSNASVEVWYRVGTYVGFQTSFASWIKQGDYIVNAAGAGNQTRLPVGGITIPAGQTYGICITYTLPNNSLKYTNSNTSKSYQDENIIVDLGVGGWYWNYQLSNRLWNGTIFYSKSGSEYDCESNRLPLVVNINPPVNCDVGISSIDDPISAVYLTATEQVTVKVKNYGIQAQSNIPISFQVNNLSPISETIAGPIYPGDSIVHTFTNTADLGTTGQTYTLKAFTQLACDTVSINDLTISNIVNLPGNYCLCAATQTSRADITNVSIGTMNNSSVPVGSMYTDFTAVPAGQAYIGLSNIITISSDFVGTYSSNNYSWLNVFIDYNRDGVFDPYTELAFSSNTNSSNTVTGTIIVPQLAMTGTTRMRIVLRENGTLANTGACGPFTYGEVEDYIIEIVPLAPIDVGVYNIITPGQVLMNSTSPIEVSVANYGADTISNMIISYVVNGGSPLTHNWSGTLTSGDSTNIILPSYSFNTGANSLYAYTTIAGDNLQLNDTSHTSTYVFPQVAVPFIDDFEGVNIWFNDFVVNQWELGTPAALSINSAYSPVNAWMIDLDGMYNSSSDNYLYTPIINYGSMGLDSISFWHYNNSISNHAGGFVQYLSTSGYWVDLGYMNDPNGTNWYNSNLNGTHMWSGNSYGWQKSEYNLKSVTNLNNPAQFRFVFKADNYSVSGDGWAIDDCKITGVEVTNDVGVVAIINPTTITQTGNHVQVDVKIVNYGINTQTSIPVSFRAGGQVVVSEIWTGNLNQDDTVSYTFTTQYMSPGSAYDLKVWTAHLADSSHYNDTSVVSLNVTPAAYDLGVSSIVLPDSIASTTNLNDVTVWIRNYGSQQVSSSDVYYHVNGTGKATETWSGTLLPGDSAQYTFAAQFVAPNGIFQFCSGTNYISDAYYPNDSICLYFEGVVGIDELSKSEFILYQNIPNPANSTTTIEYYVPKPGTVKFTLVNMLGQTFYTENINAYTGKHKIEIDVSQLPASVYYYYIEYNSKRHVMKMIVN